jgi:tetratricopeptide (TPR) repeat protein
VFVAKEPPTERRRTVFYSALGVLGVVTVAVYAYVYYASMSGSNTPLTPAMAPAAESEAPPPTPEPETAAVAATPAAPVVPTAAPERPLDRDRAALAAEMAAAQAAQESPAIQVKRRALTPRTDKVIDDAYAAYQRGDVDTAHRRYWQALRADPNNRNALLGLAAIAAKNREQAQARELYLRLLDRDPNDPLALAGLLNLEEPTDARAQESRVKLLLTTHPEAAHLRAALGNLYAREQRWSEAEEAYAKALLLDERDSLRPEEKNPDFAFNRAVALEHLGRKAAALDSYRAALAFATRRKPDFNPAVAEARVRALSEKVPSP